MSVRLNFRVFYHSNPNELKILIERSLYARVIPFGIVKIGSERSIREKKIDPAVYYEKIKIVLESNYMFSHRSIKYIMKNYDLSLGKSIIGKVISCDIRDKTNPQTYIRHVSSILSKDANYVWCAIQNGIAVTDIQWEKVDYRRVAEFAIYKSKIKYKTDMLRCIHYIRNFVRLGIYTSGSLIITESDADILTKDFPTKWFIWQVDTPVYFKKIIAAINNGWICILEQRWHYRINSLSGVEYYSNQYSSFIKAIIENNVSYIIASYIEEPIYRTNLVQVLKLLEYTIEDFLECIKRDKESYKYKIYTLLSNSKKDILLPHGMSAGQDLIAEYKLLLEE